MSAQNPVRRRFAPDLAKELSIIREEFAAHMRVQGYPALTIGLYQRSLVRIAAWLAARQRNLSSICGDDVRRILNDVFVRRCGCHTMTRHRPALHRWLDFLGVSRRRADTMHAASRRWLDDFDRFLADANGLSVHTRIYRRRYARQFLNWRFGAGAARWREVTAQDIWRFAERFAGGVSSSSANVMLGSLRAFLRYVQLRGACGPDLAAAVPGVANYGRSIRPLVLSEPQGRQLLRSFRKNDPAVHRDYAMMLCLVDLGLRASDVATLRLRDFHRAEGFLEVFSPKTGHRRQMPLTDRLAAAIAIYIQQARPAGGSDQLFLRIHPPSDRPLGTEIVRGAVRRAYARCGFPVAWTGTHRLRHTFATRLFSRGVDLRQIADLLGHHNLESTNRYAQVDLKSLRALAQPWPR